MYRLLVFALVALWVAGCDQEAMFEKFVPAEESALAKDLFAKLAAKDFAAIESLLDAKLRTPDARQKLSQMAGALPPGEPKSVQTVGSHTNTFNNVTTYNLTYEYEYANGWVVANAVLERRDGQVSLQGIHVMPTTQSLATTNRFTFEGKGVVHYVVFAMAVAIPLFIIYALIACARTPIPKRKWLWLLFVAVGLVQFQFNWTSGAWGVQPVSFALLGAGYLKSGPVSPHIFTVAFPLGAVVFLAKRRSWQDSRGN